MSDDDYMDDMDDDYDDDDDDEQEDLEVFEAPAVRREATMFQVMTPEDCRAAAKEKIDRVAELLQCDAMSAQILLRQYRWDQEKLTDAYMCDSESVVKKAGIFVGDQDKSIIHRQADSKVVVGGKKEQSVSTMTPQQCTICFESSTTYSALACGHPFCNSCYSQFLSHQIDDQGHECFFARCPQPKCGLVVAPQLVRSLIHNNEQLQRYEKAASLERTFVDDQPGLKWCPAPDCGLAVRGTGALSIKCKCSHRFCFQCMDDDHQPASCESLQKWLVKCRDDSETYNWLVANTKPCPKCHTSIEKNGGCNHMTCKNTSCKWEFCWVCSGPWKEHSGSYYNCNKYDPEKEKDKKTDSSRAALERYLHYYTRFTNHHNSLKFEIDAKTKMENKIKEMEALGDNTWMDCLYLNEANEALYECRYALKFTYVFAFYLPKESNFKYRFEMQQTELERQTEELAEMLEKEVQNIQRMEVVHCFQMAKKRLRNLMELVEAESSQWRAEQEAEMGRSSSAPGSSSQNPVVI